MEWDVPVMKNGNSDFAGILANNEDQPGTEFYYLAIAISWSSPPANPYITLVE